MLVCQQCRPPHGSPDQEDPVSAQPTGGDQDVDTATKHTHKPTHLWLASISLWSHNTMFIIFRTFSDCFSLRFEGKWRLFFPFLFPLFYHIVHWFTVSGSNSRATWANAHTWLPDGCMDKWIWWGMIMPERAGRGVKGWFRSLSFIFLTRVHHKMFLKDDRLTPPPPLITHPNHEKLRPPSGIRTAGQGIIWLICI